MGSTSLTECEKEKLHLSGMIQTHGALLIVDFDFVISHMSENISNEVGLSSLMLGDKLPETIKDIVKQWPKQSGERKTSIYDSSESRSFDIVVNRSDSAFSIEFYPVIASVKSTTGQMLRFPDAIKNDYDLKESRQRLIDWICEQIQHERVMYYQFLEDGDGHVINESCSRYDIGTYLDLRFPASDIPQIARNIYAQNPWREISDSYSEHINILGNGTVPDLTFVDLRSVSNVHIQYMHNMGVRSSLSFSVVINGELDALISCHSSEAKQLSIELLERIHSVINEFSLLIREYRARERLKLIDEFDRQTLPLQHLIKQSDPISAIWDDLAYLLKDYYSADGIVMCADDWVLASGNVFSQDAFDILDQWFIEDYEAFVFSSNCLHKDVSDSLLSEIAGVAAIKFRAPTSTGMVRLYCCRTESVQVVNWGGNPNKPVIGNQGELKISPRQSFEKWVEKRLGHSLPWKPSISLQLHKTRSIFESSLLDFGIE